MRIIAGKYGGRKLKVFPAKQMRPTTERVREAVFSTLSGIIDLENCCAIDLYAGTGSMCLEAVSRGARLAVAVEQDKRLCSALKENAELLGISNLLHIISATLPAALGRVSEVLEGSASSAQPRLFLIDPPYSAHPGEKLVHKLEDAGLIMRSSVVVLGAPKRLNLDFSEAEFGHPLKQLREKAYGDTRIYYLCF